MNDARKSFKSRIARSLIMVFAVMLIIFTVFSAKAFSNSNESAAQITKPEPGSSDGTTLEGKKIEEMKYALLAASIAFGLGAVGAGIAISHVGAAAMGAVAEKPQLAGQALIFVALAEGIVVFGFITALMIIGKV